MSYIPQGYRPGAPTTKERERTISPRELRAEIVRADMERREKEYKPFDQLSLDEQKFRVQMANDFADREIVRMGGVGNEELSRRAAVESSVAEMAPTTRVGTRILRNMSETTYALGDKIGLDKDRAGSPADVLGRSADSARERSSGWMEGVPSYLAGYTLDPVFLGTYSAGRVGLSSQMGKSTTIRGELVRDLAAGIPADVLSSGIRNDWDSGAMATDTGYGAVGAVAGNLVLGGIGRAWAKAFPGEKLPARQADAIDRLDKESPEWRKQVETLDRLGAAAQDLADEADNVRIIESEKQAARYDPGKRIAVPERGAKRGIDRFRDRQQARDAKLQEGLDQPHIEKDKSLRAAIERLEKQNAGGRVLTEYDVQREAVQSVREDALKDPDILDEIAELESAGFTREQAEALTVFGEVPEPEAKPVKVGDAPQAKVEGMEEAAQSPKAEVGGGAAKTHQLRGNPNSKNIKKIYESEAPSVGDELLTPGGNSWRVESVAPSDIPSSRSKAKTKITIGHESGRKIEVYTEADWTKPPAAPGDQLTLGFQSGISPQVLDDMVAGALKAGKWAKPHVVAGARWAMDTAGEAIKSMRDFAQVMIDKFGRAIRKHVPEMWERFKKMQAQRAEVRQRTSLLRQKGGIDLRGPRKDPGDGLPKSKVEKIKSSERAKMRKVASQDRKVRDATRKQAEDYIKEVIPRGSPEYRSFLRDVRTAETPAKLENALQHADRVAASIQEKKMAGDAFNGINRIVRGNKNKLVQKAAKNTDFDGQFGEIRKLGVGDPRKGPTKTEINNMTPEQREAVRQAYVDLRGQYQAYLNNNSQKAVVKEQARAVAREIAGSGRKEVKVDVGSTGDRRNSSLIEKVKLFHYQPETLSMRVGETTRSLVYDPISKGKREYYRTMFDLRDELTDALRAAGLDPEGKGWINSVSGTRAEKRKISLSDGQEIEMSRGQFLALNANLMDSSTAELVSRGAKISLSHDTTAKYLLTAKDIDAIASLVTDEDMAIIEAVRGVMNGTLRRKMNNAWKQLRGVDLAKSDDYFPRMRDTEKTIDNLEELMKPDLPGNPENASLTKARSESISDPIVIGDIFSIADRHFHQASAIIDLAQPARRVRGILGSREAKDAMVKYYGRDMVQEMESWITRVVEDAALFGRPIGADDALASKAVSNVAVGALGGYNPFVALKQLPSFHAATTEMPEEYLAAGAKDALRFFSKKRQAIKDRMRTHYPEGRARYEVHASRLIGDMRSDPSFLAGSKGLLHDAMDKMNDTMVLITKSDENVILSIWRGIELKVKAEQPNLKGDAFYDEVVEQADRVIRRTQPNFDMVNVSSVQGGGKKNPWKKTFSMFMSQRNTNINMLARAMMTKDPKRIAKVLAVVAVAQPVMISLVDELRDTMYGRQDDNTFGEFATSVAYDSMANNVSQIYYGGDLAAFSVKGIENILRDRRGRVFEPKNPIAGLAHGTARGGLRFIDGMADGDTGKLAGGAEEFVLSLAGLSGVPIRSPYRMAEEFLEAAGATGEEPSRSRPSREGRSREGREGR